MTTENQPPDDEDPANFGDEFGDEFDQASLEQVEREDARAPERGAQEASALEAADSTADSPSDIFDQPSPLPSFHLEPLKGEPAGIRCADVEGRQWLDLMAGRMSVFGYGFDPVADELQRYVADSMMGDLYRQSQRDRFTSERPEVLQEIEMLVAELAETTPMDLGSVRVFPTKDLAMESAISTIRQRHGGQRFRTIALTDSDHGRTGVCRTASGQYHLRQSYGPMMAGFLHVRRGDLDSLRAVIDDQTGGILLSPLSVIQGGRPLSTEYLIQVRELCDQHDLLLAVDESDCVFGATGTLLASFSIAEVPVDLAIVSSGLFAGLEGGLLIESTAATATTVQRDEATARATVSVESTIAAVAARCTLTEMSQAGIMQDAAEQTHQVAIEIAKQIAHFEFIRDIETLGSCIGIETDLLANPLVQNAAAFGLLIEAAGATSVRMMLPIVIDDEDQRLLHQRLMMMFEATEKQAITSSI